MADYFRLTVTDGYNGALSGNPAKIRLYDTDNTTVIFYSYADDTNSYYNQHYSIQSATVSSTAGPVQITVTPPATQTSDLGISITVVGNTTNLQIRPNGSNTSWGYNYSTQIEVTVLDTYTVIFNSNSGSGTMADQSIESGAATSLSQNSFTREGYSFAGWDTSSAGTTVVYDDEEVVTDLTSAGGTITLYAVWELAWGYLLENNGNYYTMDSSQNLTQLSGVSALSKSVFLQYGFQTTPVTSTLTSLSNPTVYKWDGSQAPTLNVSMDAIPVPQVIKTQVDLSGSQIIGINNLEAEYTGNINVQYSYNDSTYTTATTIAAFLSMNKDTLYNGLTSSKQLYIKFILMDENATLTRFKLTYKRRAFS